MRGAIASELAQGPLCGAARLLSATLVVEQPSVFNAARVPFPPFSIQALMKARCLEAGTLSTPMSVVAHCLVAIGSR